jgi:hypothetical protein
MEPPVGYGVMDRSIFPESQFGTVTPSIFRRADRGKSMPDQCRLLVRIEIADGVYGIPDDDPTPRLATGLHRMRLVRSIGPSACRG